MRARVPHIRIPLVALAVLLACGAFQSTARADGPKVLFVPHTTLPFPLREAIPGTFTPRATLLPSSRYIALCRRANLRPSSTRALRRYGLRMGADVIAVATWASWGRSRVVRMIYRDGRTGRVLLQSRHSLPGVRLDRAARVAMARDVLRAGSNASGGAAEQRTTRRASRERQRPQEEEPREAVASREEEEEEAEDEESSTGGGGLPPPVDWDEGGGEEASASAEALEESEEEADGDGDEDAEGDEEGSVVRRPMGFGFEVSAGFGFGARAAAVPMEAGPARLSTSPFPAALIGLGTGWRGDAIAVAARARYFTSVGLRTKDVRSDGTTRTVDARSQSLSLGVHVEFALSDRANATLLELGAGYQFRLFSSELPLSMPEYTLSGVFARVDLSFPVGSGPLRLAIAPELASVNGITEQLQEAGKVSAGVAVGAEAAVRVQLLPQLMLEVVYRESHAFIGSERDSDMTDVERFGMLRAAYAP